MRREDRMKIKTKRTDHQHYTSFRKTIKWFTRYIMGSFCLIAGTTFVEGADTYSACSAIVDGENLLSQSLLESVLRCMSPVDVFSRDRVTSQPSHSQAGQEKEESLNPAQPTTSLKTPSFGQLMLSEEDDIINLSSSEELVPSSLPIGSLMRSGKNKASSGSQPIHLPAFMDTKDIRENLLSQSLLESVLKCMSPADVFSRERVTSQPSHSQAGEEKEGSSKSLAWSNNHGPKYYVGPINAMPQSLSDKVQLSSSRPQPSGRQVGTADRRADINQGQRTWSS